MNLFSTAQERAEADAMNRALAVTQGMHKALVTDYTSNKVSNILTKQSNVLFYI